MWLWVLVVIMVWVKQRTPTGGIRLTRVNTIKEAIEILIPRPPRQKSDYIYLCREERYGRNGNLRSLRKADMTPDVVRTYFWGFIRKYWRELIGVK